MPPTPPLAEPAPIRVCPGCGVIAPVQRAACVLCGAAFPPAPLVAPGGAGGAVFARVHESDFECRGCGLRSPVSLGFGGEVACQRCGLVQAFAPGQWEEALDTAHAIADLCGPDPEGRFPGIGPSVAAANPCKSLGVEHTFTESTQSTTVFEGGTMKRLTLRIKVSAGHPLCASCHAPLGVALDGRGNAETLCPRCGDRAVHAFPPGAVEKVPALRAAIGAEHRVDRPAARIERGDAAGVAAIRCPSCGAALEVATGAELATCTYCRTSSRIAKRAWARASGAAPPFEPFWVLLQGPSKRRRALGGKAAAEDDDEEEEAIARAAPEGWRAMDGQTLRMIVALVLLAVGGLVYGGVWVYQRYLRAAPAHPAPRGPARPGRR